MISLSLRQGFDGFAPIGPMIVSSKLIPDPSKLQLVTRVNGAVRQNSPTSDLIFSVPEIISFLSQGYTLLPGTVIMSGTPAGQLTFDACGLVFLTTHLYLFRSLFSSGVSYCVRSQGVGMAMGALLKDGDVCEVSITNLGTLKNTFVFEKAQPYAVL